MTTPVNTERTAERSSAGRTPHRASVTREVRDIASWARLAPGTAAFTASAIGYVFAGMPHLTGTVTASVVGVIVFGWVLPAWLLPAPHYRALRRLERDRAEVRTLRDRTGGRFLAAWWLTLAVIVVVPALTPLSATLTVAELAGWAWLTDTMRARSRRLARLRRAVAAATNADPDEITIDHPTWDHTTLLRAAVSYPAEFPAHRTTRRDDLTTAVLWTALRTPEENTGRDYRLDFPPDADMFTITAAPPLPAFLPPTPPPTVAPGVPLGVTTADTPPGLTAIDPAGQAWLCWPGRESHALIVGATGSGKSVFLRVAITSAIAAGWAPGGVYIADGKGGADLIGLSGRHGIQAVAVTDDDIIALVAELHDVAERRFTEARRYETGQRTDPPHLPRTLIVLDELPEIRRIVGDDTLIRAARLWRAAGFRMLAATQRADDDTAVPIAYRDQMADRIALGPLAPPSARLCFETAPDLIGAAIALAPIPGRGLAHLNGHTTRFHTPHLPTPRQAENTPAADLYPPRETTTPGPTAEPAQPHQRTDEPPTWNAPI